MLDGSHEKIPRLKTGFVDVRDVAFAHLKCIQVPEAVNKRFILCLKKAWASEVAGILAPVFNTKGCKVPTIDADGQDDIPSNNDYDNTRSKEVLGIEYTAFEKTLTDMAESLLTSGKIKIKL